MDLPQLKKIMFLKVRSGPAHLLKIILRRQDTCLNLYGTVTFKVELIIYGKVGSWLALPRVQRSSLTGHLDT